MEAIIAHNNAVVAISGMTIKRTNVIANRTNDVMMGAIKAQMIETLKAKMNNGVAHFIFLKKDGSVREAWGTTQPQLAKAMTNGRGCSRELYKTTAYYDVECGGWRSFRWETLVKVF